MRIVFMGTPDFAVPVLSALAASEHSVVGVFCQPDRVAGRGKKMRACPVKVKAEGLGIPIFQPEKIRDREDWPVALAPECIAVTAYGQILPAWLLALPAYGCVNVHASLLPAYRGAAPIHRAVMNGDKETGVSIMCMDEGLDTGDVLAMVPVRVGPDATMGEVHDELAGVGGRLLLKTLGELAAGLAEGRPQPPGGTYAAKLTPADEVVQWERPVAAIHNQIRGLNPWPGAYTYFGGEKLKIWRSRLVGAEYARVVGVKVDEQRHVGGRVAGVSAQGLLCQAGEGLAGEGFLEVLEVQPAGKSRMSGRAFYNGKTGVLGECLG
ncbi:MAG: methionyl-tRNA formyltransferase [Peptococcaceae bacterium]|nr:methionyl-tRNA formyltransferase [Peptococcaceae bacterium]